MDYRTPHPCQPFYILDSCTGVAAGAAVDYRASHPCQLFYILDNCIGAAAGAAVDYRAPHPCQLRAAFLHPRQLYRCGCWSSGGQSRPAPLSARRSPLTGPPMTGKWGFYRLIVRKAKVQRKYTGNTPSKILCVLKGTENGGMLSFFLFILHYWSKNANIYMYILLAENR